MTEEQNVNDSESTVVVDLEVEIERIEENHQKNIDTLLNSYEKTFRDQEQKILDLYEEIEKVKESCANKNNERIDLLLNENSKLNEELTKFKQLYGELPA
jgi:ABC-type enterochelin transport system substrate-binding protein